MKWLLKIVNYLAFYGLWCVCVFAGKDKGEFWAIPMVVGYLIFHLSVVSATPKREALFIASLTCLGAVNESLLSILGAVHYLEAYWLGVSWWTLSLWACFATTYWRAFAWLSSRLWLAAPLGAVAAPVCYAWIERVGLISFPQGSALALSIIGIVWAGMLPLSFFLSRWIQHAREGS